MPYTPADLEIATEIFWAIVRDDPRRALSLEPIIRWQKDAWGAFSATILEIGFDTRNPRHLAALQSLIDHACNAATKR